MNAVKDDVIKLVEKELASANEKFPQFRSAHEGYAIIKEEIDEVIEAVKWCIEKHGCMWELIKKNQDAVDEVAFLKEFAICGAIELIQVAAMCQKYIDSLNGGES